MAIQWTGLFTNTGYSSANNKTQDDAVTGMQDTLYVTGPGYGAYEAVVKLYNSTGTLVATVNVSGGGGAFSAPPPVRFVDNGTVYSYSLEVVRGYIPTEDADGIVIRLVGGASKRYPSPLTSTPSGDVAVPGAVIADGGMKLVRAGSKGLKQIFCRLGPVTNHASGYTYQTVLSLEQHFDAIQLIIGTIQTSGTIRSAHYCNVVADAAATDAEMNALPGWAFVDWAENDGNGVRAQFASWAVTTSDPA